MACRMAVGLLSKAFLVIAIMAVLHHIASAMPSGGGIVELSTDGLDINDETETPVSRLVIRMKKQGSNVSGKSNGSGKNCFRQAVAWVGGIPKHFSSKHRSRSRSIFNTPSKKELMKSQSLRQQSMERQRSMRDRALSFNDRQSSFGAGPSTTESPDKGPVTDERGKAIQTQSPNRAKGSPSKGGTSPRRGSAIIEIAEVRRRKWKKNNFFTIMHPSR